VLTKYRGGCTIQGMFVAISVLLACSLLVQVFAVVAARRWMRDKEDELRAELADMLHNLVTPPDEKTPAPLAQYADVVSTLLAARFVQQVKTMLAGTASGESRAETGMVVAESMAGLPPILGVLAQMLPKNLQKKLLSNPQMVGALGSAFGGGRGNNHSEPHSEIGSVQERMRRQG